MSDDDRSCSSCGARVPSGADRCEFCGTPVDADESASSAETAAPGDASERSEGESFPDDAEETQGDGDPPSTSSQKDESEETERTSVYCHQCGFENPVEANYCSQCGTELQDLTATDARPVAADLPEGPDTESRSEPEEAEPETASDESDAQAAMQSQLLWMVGIGVVLVVGFFFVTQWSQQYEWGDDTADASAPATSENGASASGPRTSGGQASPSGGGGASPAGGGPRTGRAASGPEAADLESLVEELGSAVEGPLLAEADSLRDAKEDASGDEKQALQSELVQLYTEAGAPGRAALVQRQVADATEAIGDRRRAADLLYRWMQKVAQEQDRAQSARVARHVASAYEAVVEQRPQDLDARTRMGEAYLLTNNPMKGIRTINGVLEDDSTFVPARFQKGLALLQINRLDQAVQQFEMVKTHADPEAPFYQQAERAVKVIRERRSSGDGQTSSGS